MENKVEDYKKKNISADDNSGSEGELYVVDEIEDQADSDMSNEEMKTFDEACSSTKYFPEEADMECQDEEVEDIEYKVLIEKSKNQSTLPDGWIQVIHESGMPIYMHTSTKVCTMAKPYALGSNSARRHQVPEVAIPCLNYQRALNRDTQAETTEEQAAYDLEPAELHEYCKTVFGFNAIKVKKFRSWAQRNRYEKRKKIRALFLSNSKQLIFVTVCKNEKSTLHRTRRNYVINPSGKSYISILQEYIQAAMGIQPIYKFTEVEPITSPYAATVFINDMQYGTGYGTSKKKAKQEAAEVTLEVLIPNMRSKIVSDSKTSSYMNNTQDDLSFLDQIKIRDPQVAEYCSKIDEPLPYKILQTCLKRNSNLGSIQVSYQENDLETNLYEYTITVTNHTSTVLCKNKQDGKQRAAQGILQELHPFIEHWGAMLRLYGNRSQKFLKDKELGPLNEEQLIINSNQPRPHLLSQLQSEFAKLKDKSDAEKCNTEECPIKDGNTNSTL
ncbi:hypothetical protein ILUMI_23160 [Ignelater luminosus]|uniref:Pasha n=1 Tax=Ignelater luminosus TaxID=2038154 RepID=A0A8K0CD03_IGNLU|nr:hypothetical protein ILUMI_23160 [Ignelater luminosus]